MGYGQRWDKGSLNEVQGRNGVTMNFTKVRDDGFWKEYHCGEYYALALAYREGAASAVKHLETYQEGVLLYANRATFKIL